MRALLVGLLLCGTLAGGASAQGSASTQDPAAAASALSPAEIRELLDAVRATATATREGVDYTRVMPDLLTQILAKLDKLEDKLDKVENAVKAQGAAGRRR